MTRGAVYWHFADKMRLFRAVWSQFPIGSIEESLTALQDNRSGDSLTALSATLQEPSETVLENKAAMDTLRIMTSRCEHIDAFASVSITLRQFCGKLLAVLSATYHRAKKEGVLCQYLDSEQTALGAMIALKQVEETQRQAVLDEWAARCRGSTVRNPAGHIWCPYSWLPAPAG